MSTLRLGLLTQKVLVCRIERQGCHFRFGNRVGVANRGRECEKDRDCCKTNRFRFFDESHLGGECFGSIEERRTQTRVQSQALGLKTSVHRSDSYCVEFIAFLLLAPLIWSSVNPTMPPDQASQAIQVVADSMSRPKVELNDGQYVIHPPKDSGLSMTVLERNPQAPARSPASVASVKSRRIIEVIVSAP